MSELGDLIFEAECILSGPGRVELEQFFPVG